MTSTHDVRAFTVFSTMAIAILSAASVEAQIAQTTVRFTHGSIEYEGSLRASPRGVRHRLFGSDGSRISTRSPHDLGEWHRILTRPGQTWALGLAHASGGRPVLVRFDFEIGQRIEFVERGRVVLPLWGSRSMTYDSVANRIYLAAPATGELLAAAWSPNDELPDSGTFARIAHAGDVPILSQKAPCLLALPSGVRVAPWQDANESWDVERHGDGTWAVQHRSQRPIPNLRIEGLLVCGAEVDVLSREPGFLRLEPESGGPLIELGQAVGSSPRSRFPVPDSIEMGARYRLVREGAVPAQSGWKLAVELLGGGWGRDGYALEPLRFTSTGLAIGQLAGGMRVVAKRVDTEQKDYRILWWVQIVREGAVRVIRTVGGQSLLLADRLTMRRAAAHDGSASVSAGMIFPVPESASAGDRIYAQAVLLDDADGPVAISPITGTKLDDLVHPRVRPNEGSLGVEFRDRWAGVWLEPGAATFDELSIGVRRAARSMMQ